jgi:hypothetical protein
MLTGLLTQQEAGMSATKPYVRDLTEDGKVVIRWGDDVIRMTPAEAADLAVRILNVEHQGALVHDDPNRGRYSNTRAILVNVLDCLPRKQGVRTLPKVESELLVDRGGNRMLARVRVLIDDEFRRQGAYAAQGAIRRAIGING